MLLAATLATLDRLGRVLPHAWLYAGARLLAPLALPLFERRRQAVRANCQRVHPEWEPADLDRAVRGVFRETAAYYVDAALLPQRTSRQVLDEQLRVDGLEILQAQVAHGKGVVLAGLHLSNPEVAFQTLPALGIDAIALVEPLKNLVFGTANPFSSIDDLIKKVRLFCTIYDPATERYRFDYSIFIQLFVGAFMVLGMAVFVIRGWWRIYRRSRVAAG